MGAQAEGNGEGVGEGERNKINDGTKKPNLLWARIQSRPEGSRQKGDKDFRINAYHI